MSCCVFVLIFHDPLCPLSFSYVLPSGSLCLLYCSLHVFSYAPPLHYHTWPPPASLSSPVPSLFISVCLFSLCVFPSLCVHSLSMFASPYASVHICSCFCLFPVPSWYVLVLYFLICTLSFCLYFVLLFWLLLCLAFFATLPFHSLRFLHSALI